MEINEVENVRLFNMGLSSGAGTFDIGIAEDSASNSLVRTAEAEERVMCEFTTLDQVISDHEIEKLDYLKIDVEGHDIEVLKGGVETLQKFKPVIQIEINRAGPQQLEEYDLAWFREFADS